MEAIKICVDSAKIDAVQKAVSGVVQQSVKMAPIIGTTEDAPGSTILIYEGVLNGPQVMVEAMKSGSGMVSKM